MLPVLSAALATLLTLGGLAALLYAGWQAYQRARSRPVDEGRPPIWVLVLVGVVMVLAGALIRAGEPATGEGGQQVQGAVRVDVGAAPVAG